MKIDRALIEDAAAILDLQKAAYRSEAELYNDFTIAPLVQTLEEVREEFATKTVLKAVVDDQLVGSVRGWEKDGTCYIERLVVHPDFQGRGFGKMLMGEIEKSFPDAKRFELYTGYKSERNLHLYGKLGYRAFKLHRVSDNLSFTYMDKLNVI
jgi:ribosomal protein S18 acetylase RimI-like enzyme